MRVQVIGWCKHHRFEVSSDYSNTKGCSCMSNTGKKCKWLKLYKTKEPFRYIPKMLRR